MIMSITEILLIVAAYLVGSVSAAIIVCKIMGLPDPRTTGSGNPGATNVLRVGGKKAAAITLFGDMLKGLLPVLVAQLMHVSDLALALVGFFAFIGHLFPVFFGFKGGKGVATAVGVLTAASPVVGMMLLVTWLVVALVSRYSSLSALVASALGPLYMYWYTGLAAYWMVTLVIAVILFWRHRGNIRRLLAGEESKIKLSSGN